MTSSESMVRRCAVLVEVLEQLLARQVLAAADDPGQPPVAQRDAGATCRSCPGTRSAARCRRSSTCRLRSVVSPYERFSRAYSSLPTRISVVSSSRTTVASTFSRGSPGSARSRSTRARMRRQRRAEREHPLVLGLVAHGAPARMVAVLLAPLRVARRSPGGGRARIGQIQTSVQAGGITSDLDPRSFGSSVPRCHPAAGSGSPCPRDAG